MSTTTVQLQPSRSYDLLPTFGEFDNLPPRPQTTGTNFERNGKIGLERPLKVKETLSDRHYAIFEQAITTYLAAPITKESKKVTDIKHYVQVCLKPKIAPLVESLAGVQQKWCTLEESAVDPINRYRMHYRQDGKGHIELRVHIKFIANGTQKAASQIFHVKGMQANQSVELSPAPDVTVLAFNAAILEEKETIEYLLRQKVPHMARINSFTESPGLPTICVMEKFSIDLFDFVVSNWPEKGHPTYEYFAHTNIISLALSETITGMHRAGVYHYDIKPENIGLEEESGIPKLFDWGLRTLSSEIRTTRKGSSGSIAPEILDHIETETVLNTPKIDMWDLGLLLYSLLHGYNPFVDKEKELLSFCIQAFQNHSFLNLYKEKFKDLIALIDSVCLELAETGHPLDCLISRLLSPDSQFRPSAPEAQLELQKILSNRENIALTYLKIAEIPHVQLSNCSLPALGSIALMEYTFLPSMWQLAQTLSLVHSEGIVHLNLTPDTLRWDRQLKEIIIIGWELHQKLGENEIWIPTKTLYGYLPPESTDPEYPCTVINEKMDVWCLGAIFYYLYKGQNPFHEIQCQLNMFRQKKPDPISVDRHKETHLRFLETVEQVCQTLDESPIGKCISRMLSPLPSIRPTLTEVTTYLKSVLPTNNLVKKI